MSNDSTTLAHFRELAKDAYPINDVDWGSERQLAAENLFFGMFDLRFPNLNTEDFKTWCLKATSVEMLDEAMRMIKADITKLTPRPLTNVNQIKMYFHCSRCLAEIPKDESPASYQRIQAGFTEQGIQIWCNRHDANVIHIDFEGQTHPANLTAKKVTNDPHSAN